MKTKYFTAAEVAELAWNYVHKETGENRRWSRYVTVIVEVDGKYYQLHYDEALTERQEHVFWDQDAPEVKQITKVIEIEQWVSVEEETE